VSEPAHLADQLRSFFDASGQHWITSYLRTIDGLDAEGAAQEPKDELNNVWSIVTHVSLRP